MMSQTRQLIQEVAARRGVDPRKVAGKCRSQRVFYARIEVAKHLDARGYTTSMIGAVLGHDHTTIVYYLGRGKRKPKPEVDPRPAWHRPRIRHLGWFVKLRRPRRPRNLKRYLVPYAGADMTDYQWKERADAPVKAHSR